MPPLDVRRRLGQVSRIRKFRRPSTMSLPAAWPKNPTIGTAAQAHWGGRPIGRCKAAVGHRVSPNTSPILAGSQPYASWPPYRYRELPPRLRRRLPVPARPVANGQATASRWLVPTVIAVSAALVLGAIGVVIGLLAKLNSTAPPPRRRPRRRSRTDPSESNRRRPHGDTADRIHAPAAGDRSGPERQPHELRPGLSSVANATGFGTHAGRGTPQDIVLISRIPCCSRTGTPTATPALQREPYRPQEPSPATPSRARIAIRGIRRTS